MKEQLVKLIEMYASAKASGNPDLLSYATNELNGLINRVEVMEMPPAKPPLQLQQDTLAE